MNRANVTSISEVADEAGHLWQVETNPDEVIAEENRLRVLCKTNESPDKIGAPIHSNHKKVIGL